MNVVLAGAADRQLEELLKEGRARVSSIPAEELVALAAPGASQPDVLVLDIRSNPRFPAALALLKKQHPDTGVVVVAAQLEPALMLKAMRAGVTEWVTAPVTAAELQAAIERVTTGRPGAKAGRLFAFIGAKGGVGTTTVAVNVATALAKAAPRGTLIIDLHQAYGDAALFLGAEPRFSVVDALENIQRLDEAFFKGLIVKTRAGPDLLASSDRAMVIPADAQRIRTLLDFVQHHYQYVVLDVPRSDSIMIDTLELVSSITIVANQDLATVKACGRMATALRQRYGRERVNVIVSRYDSKSDIGQDVIERVLGSSVRHLLPSDYRVAVDALNKGRPLVVDNHTGLAGSLIGLARGLAGVRADEDEPDRTRGIFGRLTGRR